MVKLIVQYIDKSALVAEIENKIKKYTKRGEESDAKRDGYGMYWGGVLSCLNEIRTLCDTLEVKEVDLEKDFNDFLDNVEGMPPMWHSDEQIEWGKDIAKHFFELGIKAQKGE